MKNEFYLAPLGRQEVSVTGQYIGYVSGAGEIEVNVGGEHHYLNVNEVLQINEKFNSFAVTNMSNFAGEFVIKAGMGRLIMPGDGQTVDVLRVRETVKADLLNHEEISAPIVSELASFIGSVINIRKITETLKAEIVDTVTAEITGEVNTRQITETLDIRAITETLKTNVLGLVSTQEAPATNLNQTEGVLVANESFIISENNARRDIIILADSSNTEAIQVENIPLLAGEKIEFKNYVGAVSVDAATNSKIKILEVIYG